MIAGTGSSNTLTLVALLNAMIGSSILVLPLLAIKTGTLTSLVLLAVSGVFSWYSCQLTMQHIHPHQHTFTEAVDRHFKRRVFPLYDVFSFIGDELILYVYFSIIVKQWEGLFFRQEWLLPWLPYLSAISLALMSIVLQKLHMGIQLMGYGIVSIIAYLLFVAWMFTTRPMPLDPTPLPLYTGNFIQMASTLALAISIQTVFLPLVRANEDQSKGQLLLLLAFLLGCASYGYVCIFGGLGIKDRTPAYLNPQTVMEYFHADQWQPFVLEVIYLSHLYTVWPQRSKINKTRLLRFFEADQGDTNTNAYLVVSPIIACILYLLHVPLASFLELNGGVCQFFIIYAIPIWLHVKCSYLARDEPTYLTDREAQHEQHSEAGMDLQCQQIKGARTTTGAILELCLLAAMMLFGIAVLLYTLYEHIVKRLFV